MIGHTRQRRQLRVGQCDNAGTAVASVLHRTQRALGVAREADAEQHITRSDTEHLLENLADAVRMYKRHIFKQKVEVKA